MGFGLGVPPWIASDMFADGTSKLRDRLHLLLLSVSTTACVSIADQPRSSSVISRGLKKSSQNVSIFHNLDV